MRVRYPKSSFAPLGPSQPTRLPHVRDRLVVHWLPDCRSNSARPLLTVCCNLDDEPEV
jgi:hypothetical protein